MVRPDHGLCWPEFHLAHLQALTGDADTAAAGFKRIWHSDRASQIDWMRARAERSKLLLDLLCEDSAAFRNEVQATSGEHEQY